MAERRPYPMWSRRNTAESSQAKSNNYDNIIHYRNDRGNFYDQERDKSFKTGTNYSLDKDRSYARSQGSKYSSIQSREPPFRNEEDNYSNRPNRDRQYSSQNYSRYRSNQQTYEPSCSNSKMYTEPSFCRDQFDNSSNSVRQGREHSIYSDMNTYSNKSGQNYTQNNSGYTFNKQTYGPSSLNSNVYTEKPSSWDQADDFSHSQSASREYPNNDGDSYLSRKRQDSLKDNFGFRSNKKPCGSPASKCSIDNAHSNTHNRDNSFSHQPDLFALWNPTEEKTQISQYMDCGNKFGHGKKERESDYIASVSSASTFNQFQSEHDCEEYNSTNISRNEIEVPSYVKNKEMKEEDYYGDYPNEEEKEKEEDWFYGDYPHEVVKEEEDSDYGDYPDEVLQEEEEEDYDCGAIYTAEEKGNMVKPHRELLEQYKYFPPSPVEMAKIFNDLVIFFCCKTKDVLEKNPFVIICESFRRSNKYGELNVNDGYQMGNKYTKFCTLRWHGMMLVRGVGYTGKFKEPRVVAGVELINNLAMSCYSLMVKNTYYGKAAVSNIYSGREQSDFIRFVGQQEAPDMNSARNLVTDFFKDDKNNFELFFKDIGYTATLKTWAKQNGYDIRSPEHINALGISVKHTPQYWRDKILASGRMENERFILIPPQGYGRQLMKRSEFSSYQGTDNFKTMVPRTMYAQNDAGLNISTCSPPWRNGKKQRLSTNNRKKMNRARKALQTGGISKVNKVLRHVRKTTKKRIKKRLGILNKI